MIIFIDANDDMNRGKTARMFRHLKLRDLIQERARVPDINTHFRGSKQIDGVWATEDIVCSGARFHPFWDGIGDHRPMSVDITFASLVGQHLHRIVRPQVR